MVKPPSHQLQSRRSYQGEKAGKDLARWLNKPAAGHTFKWLMPPLTDQSSLEELLIDAQVVFGWLSKYKSTGEFNAARRGKKIPSDFVESYDRLNEVLGAFTHAPSIDLEGVYEGRRVRWTMTDESALAHVRTQIGWVLEVIREGAILKICRCEQCEDWFFARFSHQTFCKRSCQMKDFSQTTVFKEKRRKYMRAYRKE